MLCPLPDCEIKQLERIAPDHLVVVAQPCRSSPWPAPRCSRTGLHRAAWHHQEEGIAESSLRRMVGYRVRQGCARAADVTLWAGSLRMPHLHGGFGRRSCFSNKVVIAQGRAATLMPDRDAGEPGEAVRLRLNMGWEVAGRSLPPSDILPLDLSPASCGALFVWLQTRSSPAWLLARTSASPAPTATVRT